MNITEEKIRELGLDKSELLAIALFAQANEWIGKNKEDVVNILRGKEKKLNNLKMSEIHNALCKCVISFEDDPITHVIGNGKYTQTSFDAMRIYDRICKEFKIKQETIDIEASVGGIKKNCAKLSCADFVGKDELRPAMMNIFMDDERQVAVATDTHILFVNPNEYVKICTERHDGVKGHLVNPKDWTESECKDRYPNWEAVIPKDEDLHDIVLRDNIKPLIATADAHAKRLFGKKKEHACRIRITRPHDDEEIWMSTDVMKKILKAGTDGWKQGKTLTAIKKTFEDGSIIIAMPCNKACITRDTIINDDIYIR